MNLVKRTVGSSVSFQYFNWRQENRPLVSLSTKLGGMDDGKRDLEMDTG